MENKNNQQPNRDEIDDFAKALLNKKTDMAIYANSQKTENDKTTTQTEKDRIEAEKTFSSALDMLRKERGQSTIGDEERKYYYSHLDETDDLELPEDDFTTSSIEELRTQSFDVGSVTKALHEYDMDQDSKSKLKVDINKTNAKGIDHLDKSEKEEKVKDKNKKKKTKKHPKKQIKNKKKLILILVCVLVLAGCLGGYAYKVYVWNPAHIVTEEMQAAYDRLVAYADEYGSDIDNKATLMSDSERLELLDMQEDYEMLNSTQKNEINAYFEEQTGKTYLELVDELQELKDQINDESNASYQTIANLLSNWTSLTPQQQYQIIDLEDDYDALPSVLKTRIDELSQANADSSFEELVNHVTASRDASAQQQQQQLSSLQTQLNNAQSQLATYQQYATTLQNELASAQSSGDSTSISEINTAIASNNESISMLENQISSIQEQIDQISQ